MQTYLRIESFPKDKPSSIRLVDISALNGNASASLDQLAKAHIIPATGWKLMNELFWNPVRTTKSGRTWLRQYYLSDTAAAQMLAEYQPK